MKSRNERAVEMMLRSRALRDAAKEYASLSDEYREQKLAEAAERLVAWLDNIQKKGKS